MSRRKASASPKESAAPPCVRTCGECAKPYGFCAKGYDGKPVLMRCDRRPGRLLILSEAACEAFVERTEPLPDVFPYGVVTD